MNKEKIVLSTTLKNARDLLNSVSCEAVSYTEVHLDGDTMSEIISDIVFKLGYLEEFLETHKDK